MSISVRVLYSYSAPTTHECHSLASNIMQPSVISQQPLLVSPTRTSGRTCPPPSVSDPGMVALAVLAGVVILVLLCRLVQLRQRLRATEGSDALHYCSSYHWGRYTLKHQRWTVPEPCPPGATLPSLPSLPLPPPAIPFSVPVLCTTPPSPVLPPGAGQWAGCGGGARAAGVHSDWELYSRIGVGRPLAPPRDRGTQVFLFEHSAL
ncbi:hypothetical protein GN956_G23712 [Arapaima gigas]